jgi:hypothetical protein
MTADTLTDMVAGRTRRKVHVSPDSAARLARRAGWPSSRTALEVLAADAVADAPDAAGEFGVTRTPLRDSLARSLP